MLKRLRDADIKDKIIIAFCVLIFVYGLILSAIVKYRTPDEALYLQETMLISELFKQGKWIGNYGVGVHGFLFKIQPALIYIFTGPSVSIAVMFNVLLACASFWLFYIIQKNYLKLGWWAVLGCFILLTTQTFVFVFPTYLREIPSLFSVLLFFYLFLKKNKNYWALGLTLILVIDAKEYTYFPLALAFVIWTFIKMFDKGIPFSKKLHDEFFNLLKVFLPSSIFIFLMFFTSLVPLNMFTAFILGGTDKNNFIKYATNYTIKSAVPVTKSNQPIQKNILGIKSFPKYSKVKTFINIGKNYYKAVVSPKSFGLTSIPFFACIPAIGISLVIFKKDKNLLLLSLYQNIFLLTFLSQFNQSRYIFPTYVTLIIFFMIFLKEKTSRNIFLAIAAVTLLLTTIQLQEETKLVLPKILFHFLVIASIFIFKLTNNDKIKKLALVSFILIVPSVTVVNESLELAAINDVEQINISNERLMKFYGKQTKVDPEFYWKLSPQIPKKSMLRSL